MKKILLSISLIFVLFVLWVRIYDYYTNPDIKHIDNQVVNIKKQNIPSGNISIQNTSNWDYILITEPYALLEGITENIKLDDKTLFDLQTECLKQEYNSGIFLIKNKQVIDQYSMSEINLPYRDLYILIKPSINTITFTQTGNVVTLIH